MRIKTILALLMLSASSLLARQDKQLTLGQLTTGADVVFVRDVNTGWGIEVGGGAAPRMLQRKPVRLEMHSPMHGPVQLDVGYERIEKASDGIVAFADAAYGDTAVFHVKDQWVLLDAVLSVHRTVEVTGEAPGGFQSAIILAVDPAVGWSDINCMAPGALYGDPTHDGERSPGGTLNHAARSFLMREDMISAPLFALSFANGTSVSMLNPSPQGDTTLAESRFAETVMTDARFRFGSLGAWQQDGRPVEFGFQQPGAMRRYVRGRPDAVWYRRYNPIEESIAHHYTVSFRFGEHESFRDVIRNSWRWAWNTLKPEVEPIDVEQMRTVLTDQLVDLANTIDGRTAIPFVVNTITDERQWNYTMVAMGFVGKNLECADQLLRESDRDPSERGKHMRRIGLDIIDTMIEALSDVPLQGTGFDLETGGPWTGDHREWVAPWLRNATEGMRVVMRAYRREREQGRLHPEWFAWVKSYADWLLPQQRADGSFPRCWKPGSNEVAEPTGTTSYCPVPLLVMMSDETGDPAYLQAAIRAADYVWANWGTRGLFIGGASDNPNITDKEAGMLSLEAYLSLYDATGEPKWLERAKAAADFTESWIWIWDLPMPVDAEDDELHWSRSVPIIGVQGISALHAGSVDEYLDWSASSFAKLYLLTDDPHYLDVARILLHATKSMVALPGRQYDLKAVGFQQEGWRMGPGGSGRGIGGHRFWLPWITANHLYSITGLEELDSALFKRLCAEPMSGK